MTAKHGAIKMEGRIFDPNSTMDKEELKRYLEHALKIELKNGRRVIRHSYSPHPELTAIFFKQQGYAVKNSFKALVEYANRFNWDLNTDRDIYVVLG